MQLINLPPSVDLFFRPHPWIIPPLLLFREGNYKRQSRREARYASGFVTGPAALAARCHTVVPRATATGLMSKSREKNTRFPRCKKNYAAVIFHPHPLACFLRRRWSAWTVPHPRNHALRYSSLALRSSPDARECSFLSSSTLGFAWNVPT